jgi:hypothetical protein
MSRQEKGNQMRAELSTLFHLGGTEQPVESAGVGGGVRIERLDSYWISRVREQCPKVKAREILEHEPEYTHRFVRPLGDLEEMTDQTTGAEKQPLLQADVLSWIVKPTSIPYDNVWVRTYELDSGEVRHLSDFWVNGHSVVFVARDERDNTLTDADIARMTAVWDFYTYILDDTNEPRFRRLVRALKFFALARSIYFANLNHQIFHSALESLIYFGGKENGAQIRKRLPLLLPSMITEQQASSIYDLHNALKHEAQGMVEAQFATSELLQKCLRALLWRALDDQSFAEMVCDHDLMKQHYPVQTGQGVM